MDKFEIVKKIQGKPIVLFEVHTEKQAKAMLKRFKNKDYYYRRKKGTNY